MYVRFLKASSKAESKEATRLIEEIRYVKSIREIETDRAFAYPTPLLHLK